LDPTPQHTTGPFFPATLSDPAARAPTEGHPVFMSGYVFDGRGVGVENILLEIWHADPHGRFDGRMGWRRACTDERGYYSLVTTKPGPYRTGLREPWVRPPHFNIYVLGSGIMRPLVTQVFFPGEPLNATDRQLLAITDEAARRRLVARLAEDPRAPAGTTALRFDVVLRGPDETPFLAD
jgi:protocatechuate 3,4-dioxygenase beta subunit